MSGSVASGELKSKTVANDTAGAVAVAKSDSTGPVANSENSLSSGKKNTTATDSARRAQSLQILRDCIDMVRSDGVSADYKVFISKSGKPCLMIVLENVRVANDDFVYVE